ncbi:putative clathrin assembly protein [Platanthera zijinensis]|uniref:Clathrin assembly protein n=1 Tax=Platanthera zijinensis TaxID=2320716 RepID=A0AAP0BV84_9ASPA
MAPGKIRKALGAVKDQTSIGLAKVSSSTVLSELEVAIVKATRHEEYPPEEKHVRDIISLTSFSRGNIATCVSLLSRRLGKTRSWAVGLKALILVHRLLADGDPAYEQEVFFATRRGTRMLNMADFRDAGSRLGGWDFSSFVRTYARYLDERLEYKMLGRRCRGGAGSLLVVAAGGSPRTRKLDRWEEGDEWGAETPARSTPVREMLTDQLFTKAQHLQVLLDRLLACRPTGAAQENRIVAMALYQIVKESFQIYSDLTETTAAFVSRFTELPVPDCVRAHDLFSKLSKQFEELDSFYSWCRSAGIARSSDYPDIEHITPKNLQVMEDFIAAGNSSLSLPNPQVFHEPAAAPEEPHEPVQAEGVKALQVPLVEELVAEEQAPEEGVGKELVQAVVIEAAASELADFLNLRAEIASTTTEHQEDNLALALLDSGSAAAQPWEAYMETADWEKALVESASNLSGQKPVLAGGFDMLMLEGMYNHSSKIPSSTAETAVAGSASSVAAVGRTEIHKILALPAPAQESSCSGPNLSSDPFSASATVPPPAWVQMSEMERKQSLLVEEQLMWQQYSRDGMQGRLPVMGAGAYPYNMYGRR